MACLQISFDRRVMGACGLWVIHFASAWRRSLPVSATVNPARVACGSDLAAGRNQGRPDRYRGGLFRIGGGRERVGRTFWRMGQGRRAFPKEARQRQTGARLDQERPVWALVKVRGDVPEACLQVNLYPVFASNLPPNFRQGVGLKIQDNFFTRWGRLIPVGRQPVISMAHGRPKSSAWKAHFRKGYTCPTAGSERLLGPIFRGGGLSANLQGGFLVFAVVRICTSGSNPGFILYKRKIELFCTKSAASFFRIGHATCFRHPLLNSRRTSMTVERKLGRPIQTKKWDLQLRHVFSSDLLVDGELHALMFASGENFTGIIQQALREFVAKKGLPFQNPDFQRRLYATASALIQENREIPDSIQVLRKMAEFELIEKLKLLGNAHSTQSNKADGSGAQRAQQVQAGMSAQEAVSITAAEIPSVSETISLPQKPQHPSAVMDLGAEVEVAAIGSGSEGEGKKPPLKDRWLARHKNYAPNQI